MRMYDLIETKKRGGALTEEEIAYMVRGFVDGRIPDYQMSAMLMAIYFQGMNDREITYLTLEMAHSGDMVDLSPIEGIKVDKHSTGGVGDKTTLVVGPMVASLGVKVAKMSGRGLGHTGGTVDKLESIPGFKTAIPREEFFRIVNENGLALIGQSGNMVPADKKLYALRDVTATVDSIPLIASSIMSKKLAAGSDAIVLDVKVGDGAFMENHEDASVLANLMVKIGNNAGRRTAAAITEMGQPLGKAVGNSIEVIEAIETLKGKGPSDITHLAEKLSGIMVYLGGKAKTPEEGMEMTAAALRDGRGLAKFREFVRAQGGDPKVTEDYSVFPQHSLTKQLRAGEGGYVQKIEAKRIGLASQHTGAGRATKEDDIDLSAGIYVCRKIGDKVEPGDVLAEFYGNDENKLTNAVKEASKAFSIGESAAEPPALIKEIIGI